MDNALYERNTTVSDGWKTQGARKAFLDAFSEEFKRPEWVIGITFHEGSHSGHNPVATIHCVTDDAAVKVLPHPDAVDRFWKQYPDAQVVAIFIRRRDTAEQIRFKVFSTIRRHL